MSSPLLTIRGLSAHYGEVSALRNVSLEIGRGEAVALLGANGAGKSTLLKSVLGFLRIDGELAFAGRSLRGVSTSERARLGIGYSPEGRRIFPGMTVRDNLAVACRRAGAELLSRLDEVYRAFPALGEKADALGWQLSGGQQQMLAIGRALMMRPRLLLLDEPTLGLSPMLPNEVLRRVRDIVGGGTSVLLAEQNVAKALAIADRAYVLQVGQIVEHGPAGELRRSQRIKQAFLGGA